MATLIASIAMIFSLVAFVVGSAALHAALGLATIAMLVAPVCYRLGSRRLSVIVLYWALAAFATLPLAGLLSLRVEYTQLGLGIIGLTLSAYCLLGFLRGRHVA